jgi:hypothetical protein
MPTDDEITEMTTDQKTALVEIFRQMVLEYTKRSILEINRLQTTAQVLQKVAPPEPQRSATSMSNPDPKPKLPPMPRAGLIKPKIRDHPPGLPRPPPIPVDDFAYHLSSVDRRLREIDREIMSISRKYTQIGRGWTQRHG